MRVKTLKKVLHVDVLVVDKVHFQCIYDDSNNNNNNNIYLKSSIQTSSIDYKTIL